MTGKALAFLIITCITIPGAVVGFVLLLGQRMGRWPDPVGGNSPVKFSDFATVNDIEEHLARVDEDERWILVAWEYALLRSDAHGLPRPVQRDVDWVLRSMNAGHPSHFCP